MSDDAMATRVARLEERLAWFERHVTEQDKAMLEISDLLERLRREVVALRERNPVGGSSGNVEGAAVEERPPHY